MAAKAWPREEAIHLASSRPGGEAVSATGGCLCGAVRYALANAPREVWFCHCGQCRKAQGSAFAASVPVPRGEFALVSGNSFLKAYRSSPSKRRWFCSACGSPLFSEVDGGSTLRLRAGSLDEPASLQPAGHIFVADKAAWEELHDDLPKFDAREPGRSS